MTRKFTAIWQPGNDGKQRETEWIAEIFGPYINDHIIDGGHQVVCDNAILFDAFIHSRDPSYYEEFRGKNAFLVHFIDEFYEGSYDLYRNFRGVWRNCWSSVFDPTYVRALPQGYAEGMDHRLEIPRASERPYIWSAVGALTKSSRPDLLRAFATVEPHFVFATDRPAGYVLKPAELSKPLSRLQYQRVMLDSIFSPSPMGNAHIECRRTYEALECGSIPIVERRLGLDYYKELLGPHPIPTVRSWEQARSLVVKLLESPQRIDDLQAECRTWWAKYKAQLCSETGVFLEERSVAADVDERPMFQPRANTNLWRCTELARHHDLRAAGRRLTLMISRLAQGRRLRKAFPRFRAPGA